MMGIDIERARPEDVDDVLRLLSEHQLPPDGLHDHIGTLLVARQDGRVVGSAALDNIQSPAGNREKLLGGSAVYAAAGASRLTRPLVIAPIGKDFPKEHIETLKQMGVDTSGLVRRSGLSFSWTGRYEKNLKDRTTVDTRLGVLDGFKPRVPTGMKPKYVFLANMAHVYPQDRGQNYSLRLGERLVERMLDETPL